MFQNKVVRNISPHSLRSMHSFLKLCRLLETMWQNMVQPDMPHTKI